MVTTHLITRYGRAMLHSAMAKGIDLAELCARVGVDPEAIQPDVPAIKPDVFSRLNWGIKTALNDDFCGYTANPCKPGSFVLICQSMVRDQTLGEALKRAFLTYSYITSDMTFDLNVEGDVATISLSLVEPELDVFHYLHEWWLMLWPHTASWLIGEEIPVLGVDFSHASADPIGEYAEAFWGPCRFEQPATCVRIPARFLGRRIIRTDSDREKQFVVTHVFDLAAVPGVHRSWRMLIKTKLKEYLARTERMLSIEELADEFHMSSKTLRRRLEVEGISFRQLKEEIRREMVLKWLAEPDIPIGEISLRAGFAERNGLVRAVRSWVGYSPTEYRDLMMEKWPAPVPNPGDRGDSRTH
jgi:AraC-like DNA-binding protein